MRILSPTHRISESDSADDGWNLGIYTCDLARKAGRKTTFITSPACVSTQRSHMLSALQSHVINDYHIGQNSNRTFMSPEKGQ